jgi:hypothetical protein
MPAIVKIDPRRRIVYSTFHGPVTGDELLRHRLAIQGDPDFNPDFADVVDLSAVDMTSPVTYVSLSRLAQSKSLFREGTPHIVVAPAPMARDMARSYKRMVRASRPNFFVVASLTEANTLLQGLGYSTEQ